MESWRLGRRKGGVLLVTANVGSLFEDPEQLQKIWLEEFYKTVQTHKPLFLALHCQELGGKSFEASVHYVKYFVQELMASKALRDYDRVRIYLDMNYKSAEDFTALGSFYFIHDSLEVVHQWDFKYKRFETVTGKEIISDDLEVTTLVEKEKFPREFSPELKWSRKGFFRTRWSMLECEFDLVNIHLFHDVSNVEAWKQSPSPYCENRRKALNFVLERVTDERHEKVPYFFFGDFNFRLDSRQLFENLIPGAIPESLESQGEKIIFRETGNDRKVLLEVEKKLFNYDDQKVFLENNGSAVLEFDKEALHFEDRLKERDISFPPSYPYSEDCHHPKYYMNTRVPAWCDRIFMSPSAKEMLEKSASEDKSIVYDNIGPNVCMGDHKPVFLSFQLCEGAGNSCQRGVEDVHEEPL
ncbi:inositol polyphosphate-5-phosphatase A isoform 1-T1 [Fundulus diaphanus]